MATTTKRNGEGISEEVSGVSPRITESISLRAFLPEEKRKFSQGLSGWSQNQLNYPFPSLTSSPVSPNFMPIIFKVQKRAYMLILKRKPGAPGLHKTSRQHLLSPLGCRQDHTQAFLNGWTFFKFPSRRRYCTPSVSTNLRHWPTNVPARKGPAMPVDTLRTAKSWKPVEWACMFSLWNQCVFSWHPLRKSASKAAWASTQTCSPEKPTCILGSWKPLSPAKRHSYNCFHWEENPMSTAFLEAKRLPWWQHLSLLYKHWTTTCVPCYERDSIPIKVLDWMNTRCFFYL